MNCPICGTAVREGKLFCGLCGVKVTEAAAEPIATKEPRAAVCLTCGSPISAGRRFCGTCGAALATATDAAAASAAPPRPSPAPSRAGMPAPQRAIPRVAVRTYTAYPSKPIPKKILMGAGSGVVLLLLLGFWLSRGVDLTIVTDPPGSEVAVDGQAVGVSDAQFGGITIPHLGRGAHRIEIAHQGFQLWSQRVSASWFRLSQKLNAKLELPTFPIAFTTNPGGVSFQVDGKDAGASDTSGNLTIQNVTVGNHVFTASHQGYPRWSATIEVTSPGNFRIDLAALAARQAQAIAGHLQNAQQFIQQQQFQSAMGECQAVLDLDPANQDALNLKNQIQQGLSAQAAAAAAQQVDAELSRAQALYQQQQFSAAIEQCDAVLKADPQNQQAAKLRAQIQQTASILGGH